MKLLFIHEVNYLTKVIYEMHEFPEALAARGHDVTFLHFPEGGARTPILRAQRERIDGRVEKGATLTLVTPPVWGGGVLGRLGAALTARQTLRHEIRHGEYDAIILYAIPTFGWQTVRMARRAGAPVIHRALDVSHLIRKTPFSPLIKWAERVVLRGATMLSANNPGLSAYCATVAGRELNSTVHVPPLDFSHFTADITRRKETRAELGFADGDRVITFMGTFFPFAGLEEALRSFAKAVREDPTLRLLLIGGGGVRDELERLASKLDVDTQVVFTGLVPYDDLPRLLGAADVAINSFERTLVTNVALPHKTLQYMAAGLPVVSTDLDGVRGLVGDDGGVTWVDEPASVVPTAADIAREPVAARKKRATAATARVQQVFAKDNAVAALEATLKAVR